jgi:ABC-type transport system substrate-binding protein
MVVAAVLVVGIVITGCEAEPTEYWHTPVAEGDEKIEFVITSTEAYADIALPAVTDLQDLGLDVSLEIIDSTTYYDLIYLPNSTVNMKCFISANDPSPDPWSDWIWDMMADPHDLGAWWNPTWYNSTTYNQLCVDNILAQNLTAKKEILYDLQETLAEDVPAVFLVRLENIVPYRVDRWDNWYLEMGGMVTWINEWAMREVTPTVANTDHQLNIGVVNLPGSLDMDQEYLMYTNAGCLYLMHTYENLANYPHLNEESPYDFVPKLATDYSVSYEPDGNGGQNQVWTVNLQPGVKWHDYNVTGEIFDADDVVYSMQNVWSQWGVNKPLNHTGDGSMLVKKITDTQVEMRYVEGYHNNPGFFPDCFKWYAIVPQHKFQGHDPLTYDGDYVGTGPWMVKEFVSGSHLLLERFDDYWGPLPAAEQVLYQLHQGEGTLWLAFEAGDIDCVSLASLPFPKKASYEADPNIGVGVVDDLTIYFLGFNLHPTEGYAPFLDLELRKAIAAAIDKQNIVDLGLGGYGSVADSWTYTDSEMHKEDLPNNTYSVSTAESILTAAGYTKHAE